MKDRFWGLLLMEVLGGVACVVACLGVRTEPTPAPHLGRQKASSDTYTATVVPFLQKYCLDCHSTRTKKGSVDLERFSTKQALLQDTTTWHHVLEQLTTSAMPPAGRLQPNAEQKRTVLHWVRALLEADARTRTGDPGYVPLRRLSNAEYNNTIRDLTGVDLQPAREFPVDGAAGEGFTNASEALSGISSTLFTKYFNAARDIAEHVVLLPDGFRFASTSTRRDWTDESTARLSAFLSKYTDPTGKLPLAPYLVATIRNRSALSAGTRTPEQIAAKEGISPRYLKTLWETLTGKSASYPLQTIRDHWQLATEQEVPALVNEINDWQVALWRVVRVGSYMQTVGTGYAESTSRQVANDPSSTELQPLRLTVKPIPGQSEVLVSLVTREMLPMGKGKVIWQRPRFEGVGKTTLLLRDYSQFGSAYEIDYPSLFADSGKYLATAREAIQNKTTLEELAKSKGLDAAFLKRWLALLDITRTPQERNPDYSGRAVSAVALKPLAEKSPVDVNRPAIQGWRRKGSDLPAIITNSSNTPELIPGRASAHGVMVHPTPQEFVAVVWQSPISGNVNVTARIAHAHTSCGNGVAWWLEQRHGGRAGVLTEGQLEVGGEAKTQSWLRHVEPGDQILLAVDAKNNDHGCDLTELGFTITESAPQGKQWDLAGDIADSVQSGNPHPDKYGNGSTWSFVEGPTRPVKRVSEPLIPRGSLLSQWKEAVLNSATPETITLLEGQVQRLLTGVRPVQEKDPNRPLYDNLVSAESTLFQDVDMTRLAKAQRQTGRFGLPRERFGTQSGGITIDDASLRAEANSVLEVRLPTALFLGREFVVEGKRETSSGDRAVLFHVGVGASGSNIRWDGRSPVVTSGGTAIQQLQQGNDLFRNCFPLFFCFPQVIPNDEVVSLKMFHREDEPLRRLLLDREQTKALDHLWEEHRFISRQPVEENAHLPLFIGFVTQDQPKEMLAYFEAQRPTFRKRAEALEREEQQAIPKQMEALFAFATRAYRRPILAKEKSDLLALYQRIRSQGAPHEKALRNVLARLLVSPPFLFKMEQAPAGAKPAPISDWELATRLSYFLWSSAPDNELRQLATTGQLHNPKVLSAQIRRMLQEERIRALAIEFGAQWLHVRGFDTLNEKNERLFPTFDANLRSAIYEETVRFFQDMFQANRPITNLIDADYTFLNETLAKHYGIPDVTGAQWRQVKGVKKYNRGGVLGLASIQSKESGASRTSPVLRGNWVVETLLGERLPRPPANVPRLPEEEASAGLTVRQQVALHAKAPACVVCHRRIDPYGFALEQYDPIGRFRQNDLGGRPVDAKATLSNGTTFTGMEGLRSYLKKEKGDVIVRLFCRRLLGYGLGRAVAPSDQALIESMVLELKKSGGRFATAVQVIVQSPQFRMIRGSDYATNR